MVSKALLVFVALIVATLAAPVPGSEEAEYEAAFKQFAQKYSRVYQDDNEYDMRYGVFRANYRFVKAHNATAKGYSVAINKFADLTSVEFASMMNGYKMSKRTGEVYVPKVTSLPTSVDWRTKGVVTGIKNQGQCGSCWSFSATGSIEGAWALKTGKLVSLSEQNLMDCSSDEGNQSCEGGLMDQAFQYVIDNKGLDTEASYPYTAEDSNSCNFVSSKVGATISSYVDVTSGDESALQNAVATVGPISVAIDASNQSFQLYSSGVYNEEACSSSALDHGVLAVGYGTQGSTPYWLVKNSWGTDWGQSGYIFMSRNKNNQCGIATSASYPVV